MAGISYGFLEFLPKEILNKAYEKTYKAKETVSFLEDDTCFFILEGRIVAVRGEKEKLIYFPKIFRKEEILGFYDYVLGHPVYWEFIALVETKILVIPDSVIKSVVLKDVNIYRKFVNIQSRSWEYGIKFYYLKSYHGNKVAYAYFLVLNSTDNVFNYIKHERIYKMFNISRSSLHLIENEFIEKGLIKKVAKKIIIIDLLGLKKYFKDSISL